MKRQSKGKAWVVAAATGIALLILLGLLRHFGAGKQAERTDIAATIVNSDPLHARLFAEYYRKARVQERFFLADLGLAEKERAELERLLEANHYRKVDVSAELMEIPLSSLLAFSPFLSQAAIASIDDPARLESQAHRLQGLAAMPYLDDVSARLFEEPVGISAIVLQNLMPRNVGGGRAPALAGDVRTFERNGALEWERFAPLYAFLKERQSLVQATGADLFAYDNYLVVRRDIQVLGIATSVLNIALFYFFSRNLILLVILIVGTGWSLLAGWAGATLAFGQVFPVALAFTSTFISFNNESLVHMAGEGLRRRSLKLGFLSAIGSTLIAFLLLLFAETTLVQQIAVLTIAGLIAFIAFLLLIPGTLGGIEIRSLQTPSLRIGRKALGLIAVLAGLSAALLPSPKLETKIAGFKFESPWIAAQREAFVARLSSGDYRVVQAFPYSGESAAELERYPLLKSYVNEDLQKERAAEILHRYESAVRILEGKLSELGLKLRIPHVRQGLEEALKSGLSLKAYVEGLSRILPFPVGLEIDGQLYLYSAVPLSGDAQTSQNQGLPIGIEAYYNHVLTALTWNMLALLGAALALMALYLWLLQRSLFRVLYIMLPLLLSCLALSLLFQISGRSINLIHMMALTLVIALALDYSSVAVSSGFSRETLGKVLLTGLSGILTFGSLAFAWHPVLADIGIVVALGSLVSLLWTLFVRFEDETTNDEKNLRGNQVK